MSENITTISFGTISEEEDQKKHYVMIEQEPWPKDVGQTSKNQGILAMGSMIFGGTLPSANCGGLSEFSTPVYVYPSAYFLRFTFHISHGDMILESASYDVREEIVQCSLSETALLDYPVHAMILMQWVGDCYGSDGSVISKPIITIDKTVDGRTLTFSDKVYGSLRVKYYVKRYTYKARIEEREDSIENNFQSVVFAIWDGGISFEEIEPPSGFEETVGNCDNGIYDPLGEGWLDFLNRYGANITGGYNSSTLPEIIKADKFTVVEYCSQEIQSERIVESIKSGVAGGATINDLF